MSDFPRLVFRCPGELRCGPGKTYEHLLVASQTALDEALMKGWSETIPKALAFAEEVTSPVEDFAPVKKPQPFGSKAKA